MQDCVGGIWRERLGSVYDADQERFSEVFLAFLSACAKFVLQKGMEYNSLDVGCVAIKAMAMYLCF